MRMTESLEKKVNDCSKVHKIVKAQNISVISLGGEQQWE